MIEVGDTVRERMTYRLGTVVETRYAGLRVEWDDKTIWHGYSAVELISKA